MTPRSSRWFFAAGILLLVASAIVVLVPVGGRAVMAGGDDDYCIVAPALPYDPASGHARLAPKPTPADARCPVCGMYPARFPAWSAQIVYQDGASHFFDSPVNLRIFLSDMARYTTAYTEADIHARYVTDLASGAWLDADQAWYVLGSTALGPMRDGNLPAFATRNAAGAFAEKQGGSVLAANDVTLDILRALTPPGRHHQHPR